jgi:hypothetical protein
MNKATTLLLPLVFVATPALADPIEDTQLWGTVSASGSVHDNLLAQFESVSRAGSDISRVYQQELTAGLGYKLSNQASLYGGYGIVVDFLEGKPDRTEHRPYQALTLNFGIGRGTLSTRTRLEERFFEGADDIGIRIRQQFRYSHPVSGKLSAFGTAEFFFALNDTDWGAKAGYERWRIGGGFRHPIAKKLNLDLGYLNQYAPKKNARDTMEHIVTTGLSLSF